MYKPKTKSQIITLLSEQLNLNKKETSSVIDVLKESIVKELLENGTFVLPGIGKFVVVYRKARMGRNPLTGEEIAIPAKTAVKFRLAKAIKDIKLD